MTTIAHGLGLLNKAKISRTANDYCFRATEDTCNKLTADFADAGKGVSKRFLRYSVTCVVLSDEGPFKSKIAKSCGLENLRKALRKALYTTQ